MLLTSSAWKIRENFEYWLNPLSECIGDAFNMENRGLRPGAPQSAIDAYKEYVEIRNSFKEEY
jgi:hypothetical protein